MVTDPKTEDQYDLSSLARSEDDADANWSVMDSDGLVIAQFYLCLSTWKTCSFIVTYIGFN